MTQLNTAVADALHDIKQDCRIYREAATRDDGEQKTDAYDRLFTNLHLGLYQLPQHLQAQVLDDLQTIGLID